MYHSSDPVVIINISNIKQWVLLQTQLHDDCNCMKWNPVFLNLWAEGYTKNSKILKVSIHSLVPCPYCVPNRSKGSWMDRATTGLAGFRIFPRISIVSFNPFVFIQHIFKSLVPKDLQIINQTGQKWTVDPNNVSIKDRHCNFVPQTRSMMFWCKPSLGPAILVWVLLSDHDVNAINRGEAIKSLIAFFLFSHRIYVIHLWKEEELEMIHHGMMCEIFFHFFSLTTSEDRFAISSRKIQTHFLTVFGSLLKSFLVMHSFV